MHPQILIGIIISALPIIELRGGLPIVLEYVTKNNLPIWPYFLGVLAANFLAIILAFLFLDFIHNILLKIPSYEKFANKHLEKLRRKADKVEKRMDKIGYLALMLFVSIPLPGTGAWTGSTIAWILELDRKNSIIAIAAGITIAGLIMLLISLGIFS